MSYQLTYKPFGARAILVEWPSKIDKNILKDVIKFKEKIINSNIELILEVKSSYASILIIYGITIDKPYDEFEALKSVYDSNNIDTKTASRLWKIPVCYDVHFGIDLDVISNRKNISKEDIIKRHSQDIYTVYFIGFLPGFLYLGGLNELLTTPRKSNPRLKIEKGAVAIGENQTGVYPNESPGGWNIIGNSPINFFNIENAVPCFAKAGDRIQFYPITLKEHHDIKTLVDANVYQIESEVLHD